MTTNDIQEQPMIINDNKQNIFLCNISLLFFCLFEVGAYTQIAEKV